MADKPMLFSAPMIRALLDGRKTQTRRVLKPQPGGIEARPLGFVGSPAKFVFTEVHNGGANFTHYAPVPYATGDRLWVREAWRAEAVYDDTPPRELEYDSCQVCYDTDGFWSDRDAMTHGGRLRPSIHMPRWASRTTLTVTDVRVQRLQEISEADAQAEGAPAIGADDGPDEDERSFVWGFHNLWNSINGPGAWDQNPWVAAISFTVHRCNIDQMPEATP